MYHEQSERNGSKMRKSTKKAISALLCLALAVSSFGMTEQASAKVYKKTDAETRIPTYNDSIDYKLYMEQYADVASATKEIVLKGSNYTTTDMDVTVEGENVVLGKEGSITWKFNVPSDALYEIEVEYWITMVMTFRWHCVSMMRFLTHRHPALHSAECIPMRARIISL